MTVNKSRVMQESQKRQQIIEAAYQLFRENGFYATGVDLIMRTAKVSKRTLYKYFPTKNELIVVVLEYYRTTYREHIDDLLTHEEGNNRKKILLIFEDAMTWFDDTNFHGCLAVNAMGEFSGKDESIENSCVRFKHWEIDLLNTLTSGLGVKKPEQLAYKLFVLLEGMSSIAHVKRESCPVDMIAMVNQIIDMHL